MEKTEITRDQIISLIRKYRDDNLAPEFATVKKVLNLEKSVSQDIGFQKSFCKNDPTVDQEIKQGEFAIKEREIVVWLLFNNIKYDRVIFIPNKISFVYKIKT